MKSIATAHVDALVAVATRKGFPQFHATFVDQQRRLAVAQATQWPANRLETQHQVVGRTGTSRKAQTLQDTNRCALIDLRARKARRITPNTRFAPRETVLQLHPEYAPEALDAKVGRCEFLNRYPAIGF